MIVKKSVRLNRAGILLSSRVLEQFPSRSAEKTHRPDPFGTGQKREPGGQGCSAASVLLNDSGPEYFRITEAGHVQEASVKNKNKAKQSDFIKTSNRTPWPGD